MIKIHVFRYKIWFRLAMKFNWKFADSIGCRKWNLGSNLSFAKNLQNRKSYSITIIKQDIGFFASINLYSNINFSDELM
jgi:hypothetical protein